MTTENRIQIASDSIQHLTNAILTNGVTKKKIEALAKSLAEASANPNSAWVMLNVIEFLVALTKEELKDKAIEQVKSTPESLRKMGDIRYTIQTRTAINYKEDDTCKSLDAKIKSEKAIIKEKVDSAIKHLEKTGEAVHTPVSYTRTQYLKVTLPKD